MPLFKFITIEYVIWAIPTHPAEAYFARQSILKCKDENNKQDIITILPRIIAPVRLHCNRTGGGRLPDNSHLQFQWMNFRLILNSNKPNGLINWIEHQGMCDYRIIRR